ncbi:hypothetical protein ACC862_23945 [Rhizobium ruizarguesonis]
MSLFRSHVTAGWKPTGETGHRVSFFGKIIVTIEEIQPDRAGGHDIRWRDARAADFVTPSGEILETWRS